MGYLRVVACVYAFAGATAISQNPGRPSLSLDVKPVSSGGEVRSSSTATIARKMDYANNRVVESQAYTSTRERESQTALEIGVRNFGRTPQSAVIESLYFAKPLRGSQFFLLSFTSETRDLPPGGTTQFRSSSASVRSVSEKNFSSGTNPDPNSPRQTVWSSNAASGGGKLYGWIVRVLVDGQVIQTRASNPTLEQAAKDENALAKLRSPMGAEPSRELPFVPR